MKYDLVGKTFTWLKVLKFNGINKKRAKEWLCQCKCGKYKIVTTYELLHGKTKSCGCRINGRESKCKIKRDNVSFYCMDKRLDNIYHLMIDRCYNKNSISYKYYGGKGIRVFKKWLEDEMSFFNFAYKNGYKGGLVIDRIDSSKDYSPENCQWVTRSVNSLRMWFKRKNGYDPTNKELEKEVGYKIADLTDPYTI